VTSRGTEGVFPYDLGLLTVDTHDDPVTGDAPENREKRRENLLGQPDRVLETVS